MTQESATGTLAGQFALVTGAGAGLGQAIALALGGAGASVAVLDVDEKAGQETVDMLVAGGPGGRFYFCDVGDRAQVDTTWDAAVSDFGRLDIVVNNAGVSFVGPHIVDTTDEAWHKSIDVMQHGVFYGMRAAARYMIPQGSGSVVNMSSIRGFSPNPGRIGVLRGQGSRSDDDQGRCRRVGSVRSPGERDRTGRPADSDVGSRRGQGRGRRGGDPPRAARRKVGHSVGGRPARGLSVQRECVRTSTVRA